MYEERREKFSFRSFFLTILLVLLFVFLMLWLFPTKWDIKDLQSTYDKKLIEIQQVKDFEEQEKVVKLIDYKYFVEPNIPKYKISKEWLEEIRKSIPELAMDRKNKYINEYGLSNYDAGVLVKEKAISDYYEECVSLGIDAKQAANWVTVNIVGELNKEDTPITEFYITPSMLKQIIDGINSGLLSSKQAKEVFFKALEETSIPIKTFQPTHVGRNPLLTEHALKYAKMGGTIDVTCAQLEKKFKQVAGVLRQVKEQNIPMDKVTISSDGYGSFSNYDSEGKLLNIGVSEVDTVYRQIKYQVQVEGWTLEEALQYITDNSFIKIS